MIKTNTVLTLVATFTFLIPVNLNADTITHFGDFEDGFGAVPIVYDSAIPYDPGSFVPLFHEMVLSLPKFDPSMGTLTDITVFVPGPSSPIFYTLGGATPGMTVTEVDDMLPDFSASILLEGDISLNYMGVGSDTILSEAIPLGGMGVGPMGSVMFDTPVMMGADGMLTGSKSIFGSVDLTDFVGLGMVDTLFVDLLIQDTADFMVDNAMATASLGFDVFDSDSGADDAVIGITYTYVVPEPGTTGFLAFGAISCVARRRRK